MIEKLKSHLRSKKGFTLIELLIVIAIIAILVLIVVVAINPAERLRQADDRTAASNARSAGTLIGTCVTLAAGDLTLCDTATEVAALGEGNVPADTTINANAGSTNICAWSLGRAGHNWQYQHVTGEVADVGTTTACP